MLLCDVTNGEEVTETVLKVDLLALDVDDLLLLLSALLSEINLVNSMFTSFVIDLCVENVDQCEPFLLLRQLVIFI